MSIGLTSRSSQNGASVRMVPVRRRTRTPVTFKAAVGSVVRGERLGGPQLRLADHALVTVLHVLHAILQITALVRQRTLNRVGAGWHMTLQPVGHKMHGLPDLESMTRHDEPLSGRQRADWARLTIRAEYVALRGRKFQRKAGRWAGRRRKWPATTAGAV